MATPTRSKRVWFNWISAGVWLVLGALSFPLGWAHSVAVVWLASVYANIKTDVSAAEASDDHEVTDRLDRIERILVLELRRRRVHRRTVRRYLR